MNVGMREAVDQQTVNGGSTPMHGERLWATTSIVSPSEHLLDLDPHISAADQTTRWVLGHHGSLIDVYR
jgi:hypothetical protein